MTLATIVGCSLRAPTVLTPAGPLPTVDWTQAERQREVALREVRRTEHASHHLVHLAGAEQPHVHDRTDLTVIVRHGHVRMHLGDQVMNLRAGDIVDIPAGVTHWAQNLADHPSLAYLIATPPLDRTDTRPVRPDDLPAAARSLE